jgi:hypothetical protein
MLHCPTSQITVKGVMPARSCWLARTTPVDEVERRTDGLSVFLVDLRENLGHGVEIRPMEAMINHNTTEVFFDNLQVPPENLIGEEGSGFRYILDGMNAERILVAQECIGDGRWLLNKRIEYAKERIVFDRPIGQNQGVQFPLARAYAELEAADSDLPPRCGIVRRRPGMRCRRQHGKAAGFRSGVARRGGDDDLWRLRLCPRIRHRAQMTRDPPLPNSPDLDQSDPRLYRPARPRDAKIVLNTSNPACRGRVWPACLCFCHRNLRQNSDAVLLMDGGRTASHFPLGQVRPVGAVISGNNSFVVRWRQ